MKLNQQHFDLFGGMLLLAFAFSVCFPLPVHGDAPPLTNVEAERIALEALDGLPFDWQSDFGFEQTNGVMVVTLPRLYFPGETNGPVYAARLRIDQNSRALLPEPGLLPLSDAEAVSIAVSEEPDFPFATNKPPTIRRIGTVTAVTFFRPPTPLPGGIVETNTSFSREFWIDTLTRMVLGVEIPAD